MTSKLRWLAAFLSVLLGIMLVPFAVPGFGRIGGVSAFASGTVLHADLLQFGETKLVDTELAFSGAAYDSGGIGRTIFNEMDRVLAPRLPGKLGFARGAALEIGLGVSPTTDNQAIIAGKAEQSALPNLGTVTKGAGPIDVDPLVWADLLRGQASANVADDGCALGRDASNGFAYVADAQLVDTASSQQQARASSAPAPEEPASTGSTPDQRIANNVTEPVSGLLGANAPTQQQAQQAPAQASQQAVQPELKQNAAMPNVEGLEQPLVGLEASGPARAVSHSRSRTVFVAQRDRSGRRLGNAFGIMSEVRQTIAPVTLFEGTSNELTIEILGEWVLQAVAGGLPGTGYAHYGPATESPDTPVLRLIDADGETRVLTLQQLTTDDGIVINVPGIAEIAIGEPPRAIDGPANSQPVVARGGTSTAAAVDVVRVRALPGADMHLTDLRIGHMETQAKVPAGGVTCSIPVKKTPSADRVNVGHFFDVTFTVTNPYDCTLADVRVEDAITTEQAARFAVLATQPRAVVPQGAALDSGTITWSNIGDMAPHTTRVLKARIDARGGAGTIIDKATASGTLANCAEPGATIAGVDVGVVGTGLTGTSAEVRVPAVKTAVLSKSSGRLPFSGAPILALVATALVLIAIGGASLLQARRLH